MAIVLPDGHPHRSLAVQGDGSRRVRIGIINIMPRVEAYEPSLLAPLAVLPVRVEPVFVRLESHGYQSSDHAHLDRFYRSFDAVTSEAPLDGLLLTGAPVEEIAFDDVHYWRELSAILSHAKKTVRSTLGLCWGALALAKVLGIEKRLFSKKLFGVFEDRVLSPLGHDVLGGAGGSFLCAHSRHSGLLPDELGQAAECGVVRVLSRGEQTGVSMFETPDLRFLGHLGHPEYEGERLAFEWNRDRELGRTDVDPPANFDADSPRTTWRSHREAVFAGFVARASSSITSA
ncbi:MAG: homoserine O-succinyltransferase [Deltaproteobacteria bacterium]|nr:homoserine O-succinyltransferase [Deltaproteobacteria bacterium]